MHTQTHTHVLMKMEVMDVIDGAIREKGRENKKNHGRANIAEL